MIAETNKPRFKHLLTQWFRSYDAETLEKMKYRKEKYFDCLHLTFPCCPFMVDEIIAGSHWFYHDGEKGRVVEIEITHIRSGVYFFIDINSPHIEEMTTLDSLQLFDMEPAVFNAPYPKECYTFESYHGKTTIVYPEFNTIGQN